jgi:hypothetical protein
VLFGWHTPIIIGTPGRWCAVTRPVISFAQESRAATGGMATKSKKKLLRFGLESAKFCGRASSPVLAALSNIGETKRAAGTLGWGQGQSVTRKNADGLSTNYFQPT